MNKHFVQFISVIILISLPFIASAALIDYEIPGYMSEQYYSETINNEVLSSFPDQVEPNYVWSVNKVINDNNSLIFNLDLESFAKNFGISFDDLFEQYPSSLSPVPEPATMILVGIGLIGLSGLRKKLKDKNIHS